MIFAVIVLALITEIAYRPVMLYRALLPTMPFLAVIIARAAATDTRARIRGCYNRHIFYCCIRKSNGKKLHW